MSCRDRMFLGISCSSENRADAAALKTSGPYVDSGLFNLTTLFLHTEGQNKELDRATFSPSTTRVRIWIKKAGSL
jgi:hypothetical protein